MFKKRKKILFVSDSSFSNTGFANLYYELMSRFCKDGRFRIAEFSKDTIAYDPRTKEVPWRLYANSVTKNDPRYKDYDNAVNRFGKWRFEKVLLDFEPDIVVDLRDPPCFQNQSISFLRPYFHWCISPTVDSAPQPSDWVEMFANADTVMPYTKFGEDTLKNECKDINVLSGYGPGVDLELFKPRNKPSIKKKFGLNPSSKILGFVGRNQSRKLIPALLKLFKSYLDSSKEEDTYLHIHTAYPDKKPWNLPKILVENDLQNKVLFSYWCASCNSTKLHKWSGTVSKCQVCNKNSILPNVSSGCSIETMAEIYNCYDLYIQYASCEGLGMPILEAAASGVPVACINYSAMETLNNDLDGIKIKYNLERCSVVDAERAVPNKEDALKKLLENLTLPKEFLAKKGIKTRELCEKRYNWDDIANKWIDYLDNIKLVDNQGKWHNVLKTYVNNIEPKTRLDVIKGLLETSHRKNLNDCYYVYDLYERLRMMDAKLYSSGISKETIMKHTKQLKEEAESINDILSGKVKMFTEDFIEYADLTEISTYYE